MAHTTFSLQSDYINKTITPFAEATRIASVIIVNNDRAGSNESHIITYTVYDSTSNAVPNAFLSFTTTGSAQLSVNFGPTDSSGHYT